LTGSFPRAIDVKDPPAVSLPIYQPSRLLVGCQRAAQQVIEKERAQGFDGSLGEGGQKAREC